MTQPAMYDVIDTKRGCARPTPKPHRPWRHLDEGGRGRPARLPGPAGAGVQRGQGTGAVHAEPSPSVETEQSLPSKLVTAVPAQTLARIGDAFTTLPDGFTPHPAYCPCSSAARRSRVRAASTGHSPSCWPSARAGARGPHDPPVRAGLRRGTFTQRHSVLIDPRQRVEYTPLNHIPGGDPDHAGRFMVYDSPLSEYAVVGFEYGYSVGDPDALVLWEGPVRRLRQRRPVDRRRVHQLRRGQVGSNLRCRHVAPPRPRRPGPRPHVGAASSASFNCARRAR